MHSQSNKYVARHAASKVAVKIFKIARSLALIKDSFRESIGVAELKMEYQVFLLRRYLFQTYGRLHLTKIIEF